MDIDKDGSGVFTNEGGILRDLPGHARDNLDGVSEEDIAKFSGAKVVQPFGARLKQVREEQRRTQDDVAKILGVERQTVQSWEAGRNKHPKGATLEKISPVAEFLGVTPEWLLFGAGDPVGKPDAEAESLRDELRAILRDLRPIVRRIEDITDK